MSGWEALAESEEVKTNAPVVETAPPVQDEQIEQEIADGIIPDPNSVDPITGEPLPDDGGDMGMMGDVPMEPEIDGSSTEVKEPKGGII